MAPRGATASAWALALSALILGLVPAVAQDGILFRVNCGGPAFVDKAGHIWEADAHFSGGSASKTDSAILNTDMPALYQSDRGNDTGKAVLKYTFPVRAGDYHVYLHYAEFQPAAFAVGKRVFDVAVNEANVAIDMDIYAQAGAKTALILDYLASSAGGKITVALTNRIGTAKISGIEILPQTTPRASAAPYRINCGGQDYVDSLGNYWEGDGHYSRGSVFCAASAVAGTKAPFIYQSERWNDTGAFVYSFNVADGNYAVRLHFAEIYYQAAGKRVFSVDLNGTEVLKDFDIAAVAGTNKALIEEFPARPVAGKIGVAFRKGIGNPKISGIEILPGVPAGARSPLEAADGKGISIQALRTGRLSIRCLSPGGFTASVRDFRGRRLAGLNGKGSGSIYGLRPGEYLVEVRSGNLLVTRNVQVP